MEQSAPVDGDRGEHPKEHEDCPSEKECGYRRHKFLQNEGKASAVRGKNGTLLKIPNLRHQHNHVNLLLHK